MKAGGGHFQYLSSDWQTVYYVVRMAIFLVHILLHVNVRSDDVVTEKKPITL